MSYSPIDILIEKKRLAALTLLVGVDAAVLEKEAERLALAFCRRDDIHILRPEGSTSSHPVEKVREFRELAFMPPLFGGIRIHILLSADRLQPVSANTLLKVMEEPLSTTRFIFTAASRELLLPTIVSRAEVFRMGVPPKTSPSNDLLEAFFKEAPFTDYMRFLDLISQLVAELDKKKEKAKSGEVNEPWQNEVYLLFEEILRRDPRAAAHLPTARRELDRFFSLSQIFESLFIKMGYVV